MDAVEAVARALVRSRGGTVTSTNEWWPGAVAHYLEMCAKWPDYQDTRSLVNDAFRDAQAALAAARPFIAAECAAVLRGDGGVIPVLSAFAGLVSGNNQPCMSGDPRDRLREHDRRRFDATMDAVAETMVAIINRRTAIKETIR